MMNDDFNMTINNIREAWRYPELYENMSRSERWLSGAAGTYLIFKGIKGMFSHPLLGLTGTVIGAGLLYRGITGYCPTNEFSVKKEEFDFPDEVLLKETYITDDLA